MRKVHPLHSRSVERRSLNLAEIRSRALRLNGRLTILPPATMFARFVEHLYRTENQPHSGNKSHQSSLDRPTREFRTTRHVGGAGSTPTHGSRTHENAIRFSLVPPTGHNGSRRECNRRGVCDSHPFFLSSNARYCSRDAQRCNVIPSTVRRRYGHVGKPVRDGSTNRDARTARIPGARGRKRPRLWPGPHTNITFLSRRATFSTTGRFRLAESASARDRCSRTRKRTNARIYSIA